MVFLSCFKGTVDEPTNRPSIPTPPPIKGFGVVRNLFSALRQSRADASVEAQSIHSQEVNVSRTGASVLKSIKSAIQRFGQHFAEEPDLPVSASVPAEPPVEYFETAPGQPALAALTDNNLRIHGQVTTPVQAAPTVRQPEFQNKRLPQGVRYDRILSAEARNLNIERLQAARAHKGQLPQKSALDKARAQANTALSAVFESDWRLIGTQSPPAAAGHFYDAVVKASNHHVARLNARDLREQVRHAQVYRRVETDLSLAQLSKSLGIHAGAVNQDFSEFETRILAHIPSPI